MHPSGPAQTMANEACPAKIAYFAAELALARRWRREALPGQAPSRRLATMLPSTTSHTAVFLSPTSRSFSSGAKRRGGPLAKRNANCI